TATVTCEAHDASGNVANASFPVTVTDTTPPVVAVPAGIADNTTDPNGKRELFTATATDLVDPTPTVACNPASGSTFPLGATTVTCTATDRSGNAASKSFTVTIAFVDAPPMLTVPADLTVEATGPAGAAVSYTVTATDNLDPDPRASCTPPSGSLFPI